MLHEHNTRQLTNVSEPGRGGIIQQGNSSGTFNLRNITQAERKYAQ
jgi:hypothetical protein